MSGAVDEPGHAVIGAKIDVLSGALSSFRAEVRETHDQMWQRMNKSGEMFATLTERIVMLDTAKADHEDRLRVVEKVQIGEETRRGFITAMLHSPAVRWIGAAAVATWAFVTQSPGK